VLNKCKLAQTAAINGAVVAAGINPVANLNCSSKLHFRIWIEIQVIFTQGTDYFCVPCICR